MNRLQAQGYIVISDFVYQEDRFGKRYGWGTAEYSTPEKRMGRDFSERVYARTPEESHARLLALLRELCPRADEKALLRFLR